MLLELKYKDLKEVSIARDCERRISQKIERLLSNARPSSLRMLRDMTTIPEGKFNTVIHALENSKAVMVEEDLYNAIFNRAGDRREEMLDEELLNNLSAVN